LPGSLARSRRRPSCARSEPRPAVAARGERIRLGEFLEQFRLLFRRQADAGIRDGKRPELICASVL